MSSLLRLLPSWSATWPALIEIAILYTVFYSILRFLQGTRGAGVLRGLAFLFVMAAIVVVVAVRLLPLYRVGYLIGPGVLTFFLILAVLFHPEIRRLLLQLGEAPRFRWLLRGQPSIVPEIVTAAFTLAQRKIGALIVVERETGLATITEGGTRVNAAVTSDLLVTIFWPGTPLHDGAAVIRGDRIAAAACVLPLSDQPGLARQLGTRHRAAIGLTEECDAVCVIVSEETQQVSVAQRGQLQSGLNKEQLRKILEESLIETDRPGPEQRGNLTMALKAVGAFIRKSLTSNLTAKLMALAVAVALEFYAYSVGYVGVKDKMIPVQIQSVSAGWSVAKRDKEVGITFSYPQRYEADVDKGQVCIACNVAAPPTDLDEQVVTLPLPSKQALLTAPHEDAFKDIKFSLAQVRVTLVREKMVTVPVQPQCSKPPAGYEMDYAYPIPAAVVISGQRDVVTQLAKTGIKTEEIDTSTPPPPGIAEWSVTLPARLPTEVLQDGVEYPIHCDDRVQCTVHLKQEADTKPFQAIPLALLEPLNYGCVATLLDQTSDVQVSGPKNIVDTLRADNIVLYVDVRDPKLVPQETPYTQQVQAQIVGVPGASELVIKPALATCAVKISEAKPKQP